MGTVESYVALIWQIVTQTNPVFHDLLIEGLFFFVKEGYFFFLKIRIIEYIN